MSNQSYIRIELPGIVHWQFMSKVFDEFGTFHAQWKVLELIFQHYANGNYKLTRYNTPMTGYRVLSATLPSELKQRVKEKIEAEYGSSRRFSQGVINLIQMYIYGEIQIS